jgi:hypothetical protein
MINAPKINWFITQSQRNYIFDAQFGASCQSRFTFDILKNEIKKNYSFKITVFNLFYRLIKIHVIKNTKY